jgi:hypothetical protein
MERTAKIIQVLPEQRFNGKNGEVVKNAFVVEWQDNGFSQKLCLEVMGADKFEKMRKAVAVGNDVLVKYEATSREYQGRWYTSCSCFYCSNVGGQQQQQQAVHNTQPAPQTGIPQDGSHVENDDDLPF